MLQNESPAELCRERYLKISIAFPGQQPKNSELSAYLNQTERLMCCILSPERLRGPFIQTNGVNLFIYCSAPFRLFTFSLSPELHFEVHSKEEGLYLVSKKCKIDGLGKWQKFIRFHLYANLILDDEGPDRGFVGFAKVVLNSSLAAWKPSRWLGEMALEQALDRIERRLRRGLVKDVGRWWAELSTFPG